MKYLLLLLMLLPVNAGAGAWLQKEGDFQIIQTTGFYSASKSFNDEGSKDRRAYIQQS